MNFTSAGKNEFQRGSSCCWLFGVWLFGSDDRLVWSGCWVLGKEQPTQPGSSALAWHANVQH